jgi:hypothetical protein
MSDLDRARWHANQAAAGEVSDDADREYGRTSASEAIALRDELRWRLPTPLPFEADRRPAVYAFYDGPTVRPDLVAEDLELLVILYRDYAP